MPDRPILAVSPKPARLLRKAILLTALLPCGCASLNNAEKGALGGGTLGGVAGGVIGHQLGHTVEGAAIGGGLGLLAGALFGHTVDESERKTEARIQAAAAQAWTPLGLTDVIQMAQQHISDDLIINQIRASGAVYTLSANDIYLLKSNGVSDAVVREMQATAYRSPRRVYTATPVYPAPVCEPVYVYEAPPPPVSFGIGYTRYGRCR
jgi:hypothetical protein